ncbi:dynein regulatory complex protein 10-like [Poeciliopsis prolifica]|uniref:dynein regulatory complex protein 10-like n=1 Tax=Poeciliopsis prolifica TaxID=188132 RepID=UPI0024130D9E|nr:dynein regulatory complex protein 10-like [Poeciliopsis prolifica]XP_054904897.1 dynein regulatory complex protein 10-like [Poeciliopsis prolifica]
MFAEEATTTTTTITITTTTTTTTEDSSVKPTRKLSSEAQCISRALKNCISQVEITTALGNIIQFYAVSGVVDEVLSNLLQAHQVLVERLVMLECQKLEGLKDKQTEEVKKREIVQVREKIKNSVRDVLRFFRVHPNVYWSLREEINMEVDKNERVLIRMLQLFHSYVEKRLCADNQLRVPHRKQPSFLDKTMELLNLEEEDTAAILKNLDQMILQKDREIKNLERYIKEQHMQAEQELILQEEQEKLHLTVLSAEKKDLTEKRDQLNQELLTLMSENRKAERILQEENDGLKRETENILQTFDRDMHEIQTKLELMEKNYEMELEEVRKLQEPYSILEEKYIEIQEKRRVAEEKRQEEMRKLEQKTKAALTIQAYWRGHIVRKALKSKAKKGKKGKKGKGKGKGKAKKGK